MFVRSRKSAPDCRKRTQWGSPSPGTDVTDPTHKTLGPGPDVGDALAVSWGYRADVRAAAERAHTSGEELHAPRDRLTALTYATHQATGSLMEELQAVDWDGQRADDCADPNSRPSSSTTKNHEMEHAAMLIEWSRRNVPEFAAQLTKFLGANGSIA